MRWITTALGVMFLATAGSGCGTPSQAETVTIYKSPTCGCCVKWARHLEANGFEVETIDVPDVGPIKAKHGVPDELGSCHTALVDGYVVEGHVPVADIHRLLKERPPVDGIAVPGMPIGSPGMEGANPESYDVVTFDEGMSVGVFATHQGVSLMP